MDVEYEVEEGFSDSEEEEVLYIDPKDDASQSLNNS